MPANTSVTACEACGRKNRVPAAANGRPRCGHCKADLPWIVEADDATFGSVVDRSSVPVLLDLWAPWCGPCRMVSPALEQLAREQAGRLKLAKVDVDESPGISQRFDIRGIPTLVLMEDGRVLARRTGAAPEPVLRAWLDEVVGSRPPGSTPG